MITFISKMIHQLYSSFADPVIGLIRVYTNSTLFKISAGLTGLWTAFRLSFERDHNIAFNIVSTIMVLVLVDTITGIWKHIKLRTASSEGWGKFITKLIIYWLFIKVVDKIVVVELLKVVGDLMLTGLIIREAISVIENMGVIYPGLLPKWILKKLKDFDDDGEFNKSNTTDSTTNSVQPTKETSQDR